jgi:alkanesulfonate monooxygenase SsuD/methylene tetrahydromethanopterin reductase-like flavin-dependent oxidoreductase (luciferase family)
MKVALYCVTYRNREIEQKEGAVARVQFGWNAPVIGVPESGGQPIVIQELEHVLPIVAQHFDTVWTPDHFYGFDRLDDPFLECWTTLTWLAATFPQLKVGALVLCNNYRHPTLLAHMGKTLQAFSGGRLILGIGAGWRAEEYARHGLPFESPATRIRQLGEAIRLIRSMWTQQRTTFTGTYYQVQDLPCEPKPNPLPPIMVGGGGEKLMLRLVAELADWWDYGGTPEAYAHKVEVLHKHCEDVGRYSSTIVKSTQLEVPAPADAAGSRALIAKLQPYIDLGVTHMILDCGVVTDPDRVRRLGEDVLARFR